MIGVVLKELGQFAGQFRSNFSEKFRIFDITPVLLYQFSNKWAKMIGNEHCNIPKVVSYMKHQVCITPCACTHNNDTPETCIKDVDLSSEIGPHQKLRTYLQRQVRTGNCGPISENFNRTLFVKFQFLGVLIRQSKLIELLQSKSIAKSKNFDSFQTGQKIEYLYS